jgi:DNA polymerase I
MSDAKIETRENIDTSGLKDMIAGMGLIPDPVVKKPEKVVDKNKVYSSYEDFDFEDLQKYAGLDVIGTSEILARIFPSIADEPLYRTVSDGAVTEIRAPSILQVTKEVELKAHDFIISLEINGIKYDCDANRRINAQMKAECDLLEDRIYSALGKKINLDSSLELQQVLYRDMGFTPPFETKGGAPATDGAALLTLAGLDSTAGIYVAPNSKLQFLADIVKHGDLSSVRNTFLNTYVEDWVKRDGRIHPSYNLIGTSGFRISGDSPNLLQLPRPKHGYNVRECYTVEDGEVFIAADFSSAEVKVLANLCKDGNMLKAIRDGLDFHSFSGSALAGVSYDDFLSAVKNKDHPKHKEYKHLRQVAKVLTFSIAYGSSEGGIAMQLNVTKDQAKYFMDLYFNAYPGFKRFMDDVKKEAELNKYVITPFGQRKREYGCHQPFRKTAVYNAALRNAGNVRIQSPTSTLGLLTFAALSEAVQQYGGKAICTVYDSIEISAPIEHAKKCVDLTFYYMNEYPLQQFDFLELPIGCDVEVGTNWANLEHVSEQITQQDIEKMVAKLRA